MRALGAIGRWFLRPASVGAAYLLLLARLAASRAAEADDALDGQTRAIHLVARARFGGEITRMTIAIAASAIVIGAVLGLLAGAIVWARDRLSGRAARSPLGRALVSLAVLVVLHGLLEAWSMAYSPQLYAADWYAQGGLARTAQVLVTDVLGTQGVVLVAILALAVFVAGPPAQWKRWPGRVAGLLGRRRGGAQVAPVLAVGLAASILSQVPRSTAATQEPPTTGKPNVLILAADSLRADRIDLRVTPHLARLAAESTRFDAAYVSLPRTFPSWVTLLTGRHPHHHGIRSMFPRWEERTKDFDALPERFARAGYTTAVVSDYAGDIFGRIGLGFEHVDAPGFDFRQVIRQRALEHQTALLPLLHSRLGRAVFPVLREMNDAADPGMLEKDAVRALAAARGKPFFLTVFFSTAHFPYAAPAPYYQRFTRRSYRGRFKYHKPVGLESEAPPDEEDERQIRGLYDGAVSSIDDAMADVLSALEDRGLSKNTIVVVTADHGETLYENDRGAGHGDHLFGDEGTHVPLIVHDPRRPGARRVEGIVRDVDLAPTLYELAGVAAPSDLDGRSLVPVIEGGALSPRLAYAETGLWFTESIDGVPPSLRMPYPGIAQLNEVDHAHDDEVVLRRERLDTTLVAKHRMVRDARYKLVYAPTRQGVRYLLYDTKEDPAETRDVSAERPVELARLKGELWSWMLQDKRMVERGGYLVPRELTAPAPGSSAEAIRVDAPRATGASP